MRVDIPRRLTKGGVVAPRPGGVRDVSTQAPPLVIRVKVRPDLPRQRSRERGGHTRGKTAPHPCLEPIRGLKRAFRKHSVERGVAPRLLYPAWGEILRRTLAWARDERLFGSARVPGSG